MRGQARRAGTFIPAVVLLAACGEQAAILEPPQANVTIAAKPGGGATTAINFVDGGDAFAIDGAAQTVDVEVANSGRKDLSGISAVLRITQGDAWREVGSAPVSCPGSSAGVLPAGASCSVSIDAVLSSSGGEGAIIADGATLEASLTQAAGKKGKVLASATKTVEVTGASADPPAISTVQLAATSFELDGDPVAYTVTITNGGDALSDVIVQARMVQGTADRAAFGTVVLCPGETGGILPAGGCTFDFVAGASNVTGGTGTLMVDDATLVLDLYQGTELLDSWSGTVTLTADGPYMAEIELGSDQFVLGGAAVTATIRLINPFATTEYSGVQVISWIYQDGGDRWAGTSTPSCTGVFPGILPPGECTLAMPVQATNAIGGNGTLVADPATLEFKLRTATGFPDTKTVPITIILP